MKSTHPCTGLGDVLVKVNDDMKEWAIRIIPK